MTGPEHLLAMSAAVLKRCQVRFALIGGCARNAYAPPRATRDVDFAVSLDEDSLRAVTREFALHGFVPATTVTAEPQDLVPDLVLFRGAAGERVDVLISKTDFEASALARARVESMFGIDDLPIVTPEDLLVYKLLAARPRDLADAEEVARSQERAGRLLDWPYVEQHCADWGRTEQLTQLRARLGH